MLSLKYKPKTRQTLLLTGVAFVLSFVFSSCQEDDKAVEIGTGKDVPTQTIRKAHLLRSVSGRVQLCLDAPLIEIYTLDSVEKMCAPTGIDIFFLNPDLTNKAFLRADYAVNYGNSNLYYIRDSVVIIDFAKQDTFYCEDLYWVQDSALLRTDLPVRRHCPTGVDFGDGLRANDSFDSIRIRNPHGSQNVEE